MLPRRVTRDAMACTFGVQIFAVGGEATAESPARQRYAEQAAHVALHEPERLEQLFSRFIPHSDIGRLNAAHPGEWLRVSAETIEVLHLAAEVHAATGGAFDVAYRGRAAGPPTSPLVLDPARRAIAVGYEGLQLDLGAIGKGYALDRMAVILREWNVTAALLDSGQSTAVALGAGPPRGQSEPKAPAQDSADIESPCWEIALRRPDDARNTLGHVALRNEALSGSGQQLHGSHICDPRTDAAVDAGRAAWAVAPTAALSDALSTAFMVLDPAHVPAVCGRWTNVSAIVLAAGAPVPLQCGPHALRPAAAPG